MYHRYATGSSLSAQVRAAILRLDPEAFVYRPTDSKICWMDGCYVEIADCSLARTASFDEMYVPGYLRGQGRGSHLLRLVCRAADSAQAALILTADPQGPGGLSVEQLEDWYGRHGFRHAPEVDEFAMVRSPR